MCPPIPEIPSQSALTTGLTGLFQRLVRTDQPESTKRALAILAAMTLCSCLTLLTLAIWYQALVFQRVDGNLVAALLGISTSVATLACAAYFKKESSTPSPQEPA
ncbi:hypothetical protein [Mesoterricola silvestris]|uniref:Uncharacterized protein n=1 Tax=Mesoterricola silvestris TaxID=2927979 RepID=A0AA48KBX0_9BACT|nr:hypothetical protein [Mesoterricola silvestris]BDU72923.1 hypothetical protein METEAL_20970 [Mesoterricola silvestris]